MRNRSTDPARLLPLCPQIQTYYHAIGSQTKVLPASLTSTDEILSLAGVHHITIAPALLQQLAAMPASAAAAVPNLFDTGPPLIDSERPVAFRDDEEGFRLAWSQEGRGEGEGRLGQAVSIFCEMQDQLVRMMGAVLKGGA
ncbi:hypothetical protein BO99DRAFT_438353 [Aspergillus violaceofuscus CBS 115571]|uniref:Transaldolase n=1 Tax=Aspergillus violaceofuscus (strain CBS 115571) TaxID=1450538 RepID=A0A2V5GQG7_ASPV1|nr:hypothetical protein BO99DRAFT_438353 [Aspergillus violaceofuscus CBS 115571]